MIDMLVTCHFFMNVPSLLTLARTKASKRATVCRAFIQFLLTVRIQPSHPAPKGIAAFHFASCFRGS